MTKRLPELREGDVVLVRGTVQKNGKVAFAHGTLSWMYAHDLDIVCIEPRSFQVGDRVIAHGRHHATVMAVWPDGDLLVLRNDTGNQAPWSVDIADCQREPPAPASAEIHHIREAAE